ncbi:hypothetical protein GCM10009738_43260 [Kitasatospora viridis]
MGGEHPEREAERAPVEQVGRVHGVPGRPQLVGEADDAGGQPLCVHEFDAGRDRRAVNPAPPPDANV